MAANVYNPRKLDPQYNCIAVTQKGQRYELKGILISLDISIRKKQLAQCAKVKCVNVKNGTKHLNGLITVRDRMFVYASDGEKTEEVFRGFVWTVDYSSEKEKELVFTCYDNLIYFQESDENRYFSSGHSSKDICASICNDWGIKLEYTYSVITHGKMPLRGKLSDIFLTQILGKVRDQTGERFVMRSEKDVVKIMPAGKNAIVYDFGSGKNVLKTKSELTMEGMITKIIILGKEDDDGQSRIEAAVSGDVAKYGTLQKVQNKSETTSIYEAKSEAEQTIKDKGKPSLTYEVEAMDIPWIVIGDKVKVGAGDLSGGYIVVGISRKIKDTEKTMALTLERL